MAKAISVNKKSRGRPKKVGGVYPVTAVRLPPNLSEAVDIWAGKQDDKPGRSEAIRRLVEMGLAGTAGHVVRRSEKNAAKAKALAADAIDRLADKAAPTEEQASRKRRLLKGPDEFRDVRVDRPKK
jgi:hypothetical protein